MKGNIYYISYKRYKRNSAGSKAPDDVDRILRKCGYKRLVMPLYPSTSKNKLYQKLWLLIIGNLSWLKLRRQIEPDSVVIYQHPSYGVRITLRNIRKLHKEKNCKAIVLIHDLESLRGGISGLIQNNKKTNQIADQVLLKEFDAVICHNSQMHKYLVSQGIKDERLVDLEIFDYLSKIDRVQPPKGKQPSIAIAGNLAVGKCEYIYGIGKTSNQSLMMNLYGINYSEEASTPNMNYMGSFDADELAKYLKGDFGLVWDGNTTETCSGNTGEYLRFNNPHKTSMYLSAGMPVVVWSEAAIADFVLKNNVGITIDNLNNLQDVLSRITDEEYDKMRSNAQDISKKLRSGYYTKRAISKSLTILE